MVLQKLILKHHDLSNDLHHLQPKQESDLRTERLPVSHSSSMRTDSTLAHLQLPILALASLHTRIVFRTHKSPVVIPQARGNNYHRDHEAYEPEHPEGRGDMDRGARRRGPEGEEVCAEDGLVGLNVRLIIQVSQPEDSGRCSLVASEVGFSFRV
jgi:hypothetical protein